MKLVARVAHLFEKTRSHHVHDIYDEWSWHFYSGIFQLVERDVISYDNVYLFETNCRKDVRIFVIAFAKSSSTSNRILEYMCMNHPDIASKSKSKVMDELSCIRYHCKYTRFIAMYYPSNIFEILDERLRIYNKYFPEP